MADNVSVNTSTPGTPAVIASDDISGTQFQRIKLTLGADGVNDGDVSATNPIPVNGVVALDGTTIAAITSPGGSSVSVYDTIIDEPDSATTYICEAEVGSSSSAAVWRVQRIAVSGTVKIVRFAGTGAFNQIANNRASLTYA